MSEILERLRDAVQASSVSRYRLSKQTGIEQSQLSRFVAGTSGLGIDHIEKLAEALGFELVMRKRTIKRK